jgi:hypothetical protein
MRKEKTMTDVREAIDRIGERVDPPGNDLADLLRRRDRIRARKRVTAAGLALMIATGGVVIAARAFLAPTSQPTSRVRVAASWPAPRAAVMEAETICPTPSGDDPPPVVLSSDSGPAGSSVDVSGTFPKGTVFLQLWWNADGQRLPATLAPPPWPPSGPEIRFESAVPGPVVKLAAVAGPDSTGDCSYGTRFTVPDAEPGTYELLWVMGAVNPSPGYGLLTSEVPFEVTD